MRKYSVVESSAIVAAQKAALLEGREYLPVPAWTKIVELHVDFGPGLCGVWMEEGEEFPCGRCSYDCRVGEATVLVAFREGMRYKVSLRGREIDPRLGVSMEHPTRVMRVR